MDAEPHEPIAGYALDALDADEARVRGQRGEDSGGVEAPTAEPIVARHPA